MYARIARFDGLDPSRIDEQIAERRRHMDGARWRRLPDGAPEQALTLVETVRQVYQCVDRERGTALTIMLCDTREDALRTDTALNGMDPAEGEGQRSSVEILEVVWDEDFTWD